MNLWFTLPLLLSVAFAQAVPLGKLFSALSNVQYERFQDPFDDYYTLQVTGENDLVTNVYVRFASPEGKTYLSAISLGTDQMPETGASAYAFSYVAGALLTACMGKADTNAVGGWLGSRMEGTTGQYRRRFGDVTLEFKIEHYTNGFVFYSLNASRTGSPLSKTWPHYCVAR